MRNFIKRKLICLKNPTVRIGKRANVSGTAAFGGYNRIGAGSVFSGRLGRYSYLGEECRINADIGKFCSVGNRVVTVSGTHPTRTWVSTHPAFYSCAKQCGTSFVSETLFDETTTPAVIGNDVWIGAGALLVGGISVGDGAVIAAGAVVTMDVPPYTVVGGVPAKEIRKRFDADTAERLQRIAWWDWPDERLQELRADFSDVDAFLAGQSEL
ncbi:MAG: CatB-related O-acetyltransferase [Oscillospiraceae bacterium]|nr:CatB-related O-acetyltransferase [Oscillospiraceae bacterium]